MSEVFVVVFWGFPGIKGEFGRCVVFWFVVWKVVCWFEFWLFVGRTEVLIPWGWVP